MIAVLYAKASIGMCLCVNIMLARFFLSSTATRKGTTKVRTQSSYV